MTKKTESCNIHFAIIDALTKLKKCPETTKTEDGKKAIGVKEDFETNFDELPTWLLPDKTV